MPLQYAQTSAAETEMAELQAKLVELQMLALWMKSSKFWKLRTLLYRLRKVMLLPQSSLEVEAFQYLASIETHDGVNDVSQKQNYQTQEASFNDVYIPVSLNLELVSANISPSDEMYYTNPHEHYFSVGQSALTIIENSLALEKRTPAHVTQILDIPCGHGRVTRFLRAKFPHADIVVSDLNQDGVDFCAKEFDAVGVYSSEDFSDVSFDRCFDLIWVGSLITHFSPEQTRAFLSFVTQYLTKDGMLIFSSHGSYVAGRLPFAGYGLSDLAIHQTLDDFFNTGYGYADYPDHSSYGTSLVSKGWIDDFFQTTHCFVTQWYEHQWDHHQDVYVVRRSP
jgi:trans-aconitate methyltransferase